MVIGSSTVKTMIACQLPRRPFPHSLAWIHSYRCPRASTLWSFNRWPPAPSNRTRSWRMIHASSPHNTKPTSWAFKSRPEFWDFYKKLRDLLSRSPITSIESSNFSLVHTLALHHPGLSNANGRVRRDRMPLNFIEWSSQAAQERYDSTQAQLWDS